MKKNIFFLISGLSLNFITTFLYAQPVCFSSSSQQFIFASGGIYGAVADDFNGDGLIDLVTSNSTSNTISFMLGNGNGGFAASVNYATGSVASGMNKGDFNNDGNLDVVVTNQVSHDISVLLGNGNGTFNNAINTPIVGGSPQVVICYDFDNDTILDLAVGCYSSALIILKGDGTGNFSVLNTYVTGAWMGSITLADFNNDDTLDIALPGGFAYNILFLQGHGEGNFATPVLLPCTYRPFYLMAKDLNNDTLPDIITANWNDTSVSVFFNTGNFSFAPPVNYLFAGPMWASPGFVYLSDFNNDSIQDILVSFHTLSGISVLPGTGSGNFSTEQHFNGGSGTNVAIAVDLNQDNKTDVISPSANSPVFYVFLNCTPTGVAESSAQNTDVKIFPNPVFSEMNIQNNSSQLIHFTLYNALGEKLIDKKFDKKFNTIDLSATLNGMYYYNLISKISVIKSGKIIKE